MRDKIMAEENKTKEIKDNEIENVTGGEEGWARKDFNDTCDNWKPKYDDKDKRFCENCKYSNDTGAHTIFCAYKG